jgi:S1-C subfamily serine protease
VIVSPDGRILTNAHVVDGAVNVRVTLNDEREYPGKVVGIDKPSDLAVVQIKADRLPTLALGDSDRPRIGDVVLAVGKPLGLGETVTMGILSARGRTTDVGVAATRTSCRPIRRSTRATRAARSSPPAATSSASPRRSCRRRAATSASASRFRRTWRST